MIIARTTLICLATTLALLALTACDDDSKKEKPEYEVEIYFSEDVKIVFQEMKSERAFKKPRIHVDHPEGVDVTHEERPPRKKTVFEFTPNIPLNLIVMFLVTAIIRRYIVPSKFLKAGAIPCCATPIRTSMTPTIRGSACE